MPKFLLIVSLATSFLFAENHTVNPRVPPLPQDTVVRPVAPMPRESDIVLIRITHAFKNSLGREPRPDEIEFHREIAKQNGIPGMVAAISNSEEARSYRIKSIFQLELDRMPSPVEMDKYYGLSLRLPDWHKEIEALILNTPEGLRKEITRVYHMALDRKPSETEIIESLQLIAKERLQVFPNPQFSLTWRNELKFDILRSEEAKRKLAVIDYWFEKYVGRKPSADEKQKYAADFRVTAATNTREDVHLAINQLKSNLEKHPEVVGKNKDKKRICRMN